MPNKKSAVKALRQSKKNNDYNRSVKRTIKEALKDVRAAIEKKEATATEKLRNVQKVLDTAVSKKVIKKNKASRLNSRLATMAKSKK
jgi:small subunit ribosomal protein S20